MHDHKCVCTIVDAAFQMKVVEQLGNKEGKVTKVNGNIVQRMKQNINAEEWWVGLNSHSMPPYQEVLDSWT